MALRIPTVRIPAGRYRIGADVIAEAEAPNPPHEVQLSAFCIGVFPVTNADYRAFVDATGAAPPRPWSDPRFASAEQPVVGVDWTAARAFARWAGGALPTEAQWEAACGPARFPWGDDDPTERHAHFARDWNRDATAPIGGRQGGASPFGCLDLAGNVWEWCDDVWRTDAHLHHAGLDPRVDGPGDVRPLRGGSWRNIEPKLQRAYRNWFHRAAAHLTIGLRIVLPDAPGA